MSNVAISREVAANVLFVFGMGGYEPGSFAHSLLNTIAKADSWNRSLLAEIYPEHVEAYRLASESENGIAELRDIAGITP